MNTVNTLSLLQDCIDALHGELQSNHVTIAELQKSLSSAVAENQALLESNVCLQEDQLGGGAVAERCVSESPSGERTSLEEWNREVRRQGGSSL